RIIHDAKKVTQRRPVGTQFVHMRPFAKKLPIEATGQAYHNVPREWCAFGPRPPSDLYERCCRRYNTPSNETLILAFVLRNDQLELSFERTHPMLVMTRHDLDGFLNLALFSQLRLKRGVILLIAVQQ